MSEENGLTTGLRIIGAIGGLVVGIDIYQSGAEFWPSVLIGVILGVVAGSIVAAALEIAYQILVGVAGVALILWRLASITGWIADLGSV